MPDILEEKDWELLLRRIKDEQCTPFLGVGACSEEIPVSFIANEWAKKYDYPMGDSYDLTEMAQFVAVTEEDALIPKDEICKKIKELVEEITPKYFRTPDELHGVLADLSLPVYITTNYDDLMERALKSRGITPIQEICRWNESLKQRIPTSLNFVPTSEKPLVYHLHGCYEIPESLVLTEDDYFDFFAANSREKDLFPPYVKKAFTDTSLLLLGYRINDWDFRVLFRILAKYLELSMAKKHISVQLVPENIPETKREKAKKYLDRYFADHHIQVYWQDCREFATELRKRREYARKREQEKTPSPDIVRFTPLHRDLVSILFLAADPTNASRLRLGEEFREIQEKLQLAEFRDRFTLELPQLSVRAPDISQALIKAKPQIVHFSGHGTSTGAICIENQVGETHPIEPDTLAALFKKFSNNVECVILNACYSDIQAKAIAKHINYVIGMNQEIGDKAAIAFSIGFYQALGGGYSFEDAYDLGCVQIQLENIPEHLTPVLIKKIQELSPPSR